VVIVSLVGVFLGCTLSVILWFEVAKTPEMTSGERAGFVAAGLIETFLCLASILGLIGAIVRKRFIVQIYAYTIYIHFILNVVAAGCLLYIVAHFPANDQTRKCLEAMNLDALVKEPCAGLLKIARWVFYVLVIIVLLVEMCGAVVVTLYVNQIKTDQEMARSSRMTTEEAFRLVSKGKDVLYSAIPGSQPVSARGPTFSHYTAKDYDPYEEIRGPAHGDGPSNFYREEVPAPPVEVGYGGGLWTHEEISSEEKARLKRMDNLNGVGPTTAPDDEEAERRRREIKSPSGPPPPVQSPEDELPTYTLPVLPQP